jgi:hypothetical protein
MYIDNHRPIVYLYLFKLAMYLLFLAPLLLMIGTLFVSVTVKANSSITQRYHFNCSQSGQCEINNPTKKEILSVSDLSPGETKIIKWYLSNHSQQACRIYLRLNSSENKQNLSPDFAKLVTITAYEEGATLSEKNQYGEKVASKEKATYDQKIVLKPTKFHQFFEKPGIYLTELSPSLQSSTEPKSTIITWKIQLSSQAPNSIQDQAIKFKPFLYAHCLAENSILPGEINQTKNLEQTKQILKGLLSTFGLFLLIFLIKFTKKNEKSNK